MSEQDTLRLVAEVVDRFSTPLKNLRGQLQGLSREGTAHAETLGKGFQKLEGSLKGVAQTTTTVLNPALATVGVTSLTVGAAIAGVGASLRSFAGNTAVLAQASRDTGVAAQTLRDVQNILGKVGVSAEQSGTAIVGFAEKMRLARDGIGPVMEFLRTQGRTAEGRKYFNDLADSLQHSKDNGDALVKALKGMEGIKDPVGRRLYAEQVLGLADAARLAEKHRGTIEEQLGKAAKALGPLDPKSLEASERFEKSMQSLQTTLQKLGTTVGTEVLPYAERLATWFDELAQGKRQDITKPLQDGLREVGRALREIDWESAGKTAKEMLGLIGQSAAQTGKAVQGIVLALQAINDVKNGDVSGALKKLNQLDRATDLGMGQGLPAGSIADGMRADTGPLMQRQDQIRRQMQVLDEVIARKESQPDPLGGDGRQQATEEREKRQKLIDETAKLQGEIKRLRDAMPDKKPGEAGVQQSSADGDGPFMGARVQTAALGGGAFGAASAVGRMLRSPGGIYAPRGSGGGGGYGEGGGGVPRPRSGGPGERVGRFQRGEGEGSPDATPRLKGQGAVPKGMDERAQRVMARLIAHGWTPEAAASAVGQAIEESSVRSDGPLGDTARFGFGDAAAHGMFQWRDSRFRALKKFAEARGKPWTDFDTQVDFFNEERKGRSRAERNWHTETDIGRGNVIGQTFEGYKGGLQAQRERHARRQLEIYRRRGAPIPEREGGGQASGDGDFFPNGAPRVLKPNSMPDAPGMTMSEADRRRAGIRDGMRRPEVLMDPNDERRKIDPDEDPRAIRAAGIGFRDIGRRARERQSELEAEARRGTAVAEKSRAAEAAAANVNGQVTVNVMRPGPDTKVNTSTSGNLFRDAPLRKGEVMRSSD